MAQDYEYAKKFIDIVPVDGRVDLSVLTWKDAIPSEKFPTENTIFASGTSYNEGRNMLLSHGIERERRENKEYLYFIFLDDDANLVCNCTLTPGKITDERPTECIEQDPRACWDQYEDFLYEWEPAVGVPFIWFGTDRWVENSPVTGCYFHDPMFEGMHREIVEFLLPYMTRYDDIAWMGGTLVHIHKSSIFFKNHKLQLNYVQVMNPVHRSYPKTEIDPIVNKDISPCIRDIPALNETYHYDFFKVAEPPHGKATKKPAGLNYNKLLEPYKDYHPPANEICQEFWHKK